MVFASTGGTLTMGTHSMNNVQFAGCITGSDATNDTAAITWQTLYTADGTRTGYANHGWIAHASNGNTSTCYTIDRNWTGIDTCTSNDIQFNVRWNGDQVWTVNNCSKSIDIEWKFPTPINRLREIIRSRCAPGVIIRDSGLAVVETPRYRPASPTTDIRELRARQTLFRIIGPDAYRRFLRRGFVTATNAKSGRTYQMFPGHDLTNVFEDGKCIKRLCVYLAGNFPPTDALIVRYLLAVNDDERLWRLANKSAPMKRPEPKPVESRPLADVFRELKGKAA